MDAEKESLMREKRRERARVLLASEGIEKTREDMVGGFQTFSFEMRRMREGGLDLSTSEQTRLLLSHLNVEPTMRLTTLLEENLSTTWVDDPPRLAPHVRDVLDFLPPHASIGLISNTGWTSGRVVRTMLESFGIGKYFSTLTFSCEVGLWKPNPEIFLLTAKKLGHPPGLLAHVGDSLKADVGGARGVGMTSLFLGESEEADFCIHDLSEIRLIWEKMASHG